MRWKGLQRDFKVITLACLGGCFNQNYLLTINYRLLLDPKISEFVDKKWCNPISKMQNIQMFDKIRYFNAIAADKKI